MTSPDAKADTPPVILLGGDVNALSVARTLSRAGIEVHALNFADRLLRYSRACRWIELGPQSSEPKDWEAYLLGPQSDPLRGAVLLACNDDAIEIVVRHADRLAEKFILEEVDPEVRQSLLDKLSTYELAARAGLPVPRHWHVSSAAELADLESDLVFPLILKPIFSHKFRQVWGTLKYFRAETMADVQAYFEKAKAFDIEVVLMEFIPGDDDKDCSYYAYMGDDGEPLAELTKRCIRRNPPNMGGECFGVTDWSPEVRELGLSFFRLVDYKGAGQIQFKRDKRDGQLKIIECNARFAAPTCLVAASGVDLAGITYDRLTGRNPIPKHEPGRYKTGLHWWLPIDDLQSFLALRRAGKLGFGAWLLGVCRPSVLPIFRWDDPLPSLVGVWRRVKKLVAKRLFRRSGGAAP